jgi:DNA-binding transcriptional LysR family regulator
MPLAAHTGTPRGMPNLTPRSTPAVPCTFVQTGLGVAIVHSLCIGHALPRSVRWIDLGQQFGTIPFSAVFRRGATDSPLIRGLLDELMTTRTTLPGTKKPPVPRTRPE